MTRIIAIDDSRTVRMFVEMTLKQVGYDVQSCADLFEITPEAGRPVDLVLVDVNMDEFLGTDLVAHIRQNWPGESLIYLYSELSEPELEQRMQRCGADGYISKRSGYDGLVDQVVEAIGRPD